MTSHELSEAHLTEASSMRNHISYVSELYLRAATTTSSSRCTQLAFVTLTCKYGMGNSRQNYQ